MLTSGDPPFDAIVRLALAEAAREIGATASRLAVYSGKHRTPTLVVGWGRAEREEPRFVEPGAVTSSPGEIVAGVTIGGTAGAVLEFHRLGHPFSASSARLVSSAAAVLAPWLAGVLLGRGEAGDARAPGRPLDFVQLLQEHVDRSGRLRLGGAIAAVLVNAPAQSQLEELVKILQRHVRASDLVGRLPEVGAGVLLPEMPPEAAHAAAERLSRAAGAELDVPVRAAAVAVAPSSEAPQYAVERALADARRSRESS
jgi:hypothetical protein